MKKQYFFTALIAICVVFLQGSPTQAYFSATPRASEGSESNGRIGAGIWIPEMTTMVVDPVEPDGTNGFYVTEPCVKLGSDNATVGTENIVISYRFIDALGVESEWIEHDPNDICIPNLPDSVNNGETTIEAYAQNTMRSDWKGDVQTISYKKDTSAPVVSIDGPADRERVQNSVDIYGTVEDNNPSHYYLVIKNNSGVIVAGPTIVPESSSLSGQKLFSWDTTELNGDGTRKYPDGGVYTIRLAARDLAGNRDDSVSMQEIKVIVSNDLPPMFLGEISHLIESQGSGNPAEVTITWETNENATSRVVYDTVSRVADASLYTYSSPIDGDADQVVHAVELLDYDFSSVIVPTTFYYRVVSRDIFGNENISAEYAFTITPAALPSVGTIVLNEILPNPDTRDEDGSSHDDTVLAPYGEWVELYNTSNADVEDITGWYIQDLADHSSNPGNPDKSIKITTLNSDSNGDFDDKNEFTDGKIGIPAEGYLVVYLVGNSGINSGYLNNSGDEVYLYNSADELQDSVAFGATPDGKSIARFPDGTGPWIDPIGTPGKENTLSDEELQDFRELTFDECFDRTDRIQYTDRAECHPVFLEFIGMIDDKDSDKLDRKEFLEIVAQESAENEVVEEVIEDNATETKVNDNPIQEEVVEENIDRETLPMPLVELETVTETSPQESTTDEQTETPQEGDGTTTTDEPSSETVGIEESSVDGESIDGVEGEPTVSAEPDPLTEQNESSSDGVNGEDSSTSIEVLEADPVKEEAVVEVVPSNELK